MSIVNKFVSSNFSSLRVIGVHTDRVFSRCAFRSTLQISAIAFGFFGYCVQLSVLLLLQLQQLLRQQQQQRQRQSQRQRCPVRVTQAEQVAFIIISGEGGEANNKEVAKKEEKEKKETEGEGREAAQ